MPTTAAVIWSGRAMWSRPSHATIHIAAILCALALGASLSGCDQKPAFVFVLEAPQSIDVVASASARAVGVGEVIVLTAQRTTRGTWKRIASRDLKPDQCWMAALPPEHEAAVADNLHWVVDPQGAATFNTDFRPDHARTVVLSKEGVFTFTASTAVWCEPRAVSAPPFHVEVTQAPRPPPTASP